MKAAVIDEYGSCDVIKVIDTYPQPVLAEDKLIVEVRAAGLNPIDYKIRSGNSQKFMPIQFPKVLGLDLAGTISEIGSKVDGFSVGDEVYGQADFFSSDGSLAEFATASPNSLSPKPTNIDFPGAASLPLAAVSAYQAIIDNMSLKDGQKVLIQGGAGGIGILAIQIAKHLGASVATTVSAKDVDYVLGLGADEAIDYTAQDFSKLLKDYDGVLDLIGGDVYKKSFEVLKPNGIIVSLTEQPDSELAEKYNVNARHQFTKVDAETLLKVSKLVEDGSLKPQIAKILPLDSTKEAYELLENGHPRGKVVVIVSD
jgi:NADPH:quinone reductase-like Zn-dependent oxidoreductase